MTFANGSPVVDYRSHVQNTDKTKLEKFVSAMLHRGVRCKAGLWFISEAHTDQDIEYTLQAAAESFQEMCDTKSVESKL